MQYSRNFFEKLLVRGNWPAVSNPEFMDELNEIADQAYSKGTLEGYMAALLIYHQLTEEMIKALLECSHFFLQCRIYPTELQLKVEKDKMYGYYITELEKTISFDGKEEFIYKCKQLNRIRIDIVHRLTRKTAITDIQKRMAQTKELFDEIFETFSDAQDWFRLCFKDFRKDSDWIDYIEQFEEVIADTETELRSRKDKQLETTLAHARATVQVLREYYELELQEAK